MRPTLSSLRSDLATFKMQLETYNDFNGGQLENKNNLWCICQVPLIPRGLSRYRIYSKSISDKCSLDDEDVTVLFAVGANGQKTPPVFLISMPYMSSQWFYPLNEQNYSIQGERHKLTCSDWFPTGALPMCVESQHLNDRELDLVVHHMKTFIKQIVPIEESILLLFPSKFGVNVRFFFSVCDIYSIEYALFPESLQLYLDPFYRNISRSFLTAFKKEAETLDRMHRETRSTIQMKIMLGVLAYDAITQVDIVKSFGLCGLSPFVFRTDLDEFIKNEVFIPGTAELSFPKFA